MLTAMVTGANRGIGLAVTKAFVGKGWKVLATCRSRESAGELENLESEGRIEVGVLDIRDRGSIRSLMEKWRDVRLDALINNAGVLGEIQSQAIGSVDYEDWAEVLSTNLLGQIRVTEAALPLLRMSSRKVVVMMSSDIESDEGYVPEGVEGGMYAYRSSKAALNVVSRALAHDLRPQGIKVLIFGVSWTKSDMGGEEAPIRPEQVADWVVYEVEWADSESSGTFHVR